MFFFFLVWKVFHFHPERKDKKHQNWIDSFYSLLEENSIFTEMKFVFVNIVLNYSTSDLLLRKILLGLMNFFPKNIFQMYFDCMRLLEIPWSEVQST